MSKLILSLLFTYFLFHKEIHDFVVDKMVQRSMKKYKIDEAVVKAFIIANKNKSNKKK